MGQEVEAGLVEVSRHLAKVVVAVNHPLGELRLHVLEAVHSLPNFIVGCAQNSENFKDLSDL